MPGGRAAQLGAAQHGLVTQRVALPERPASYPASTAQAGSAATAESVATARAIVAPVAAPTRLAIPSIGVDAAVEAVGLDPEGHIGGPSRSDRVAWYRLGPAPGDPGNAVIDGHLDWTDGPAVFWRLERLHQGDEVVVVRADSSHAKFLVDSTSLAGYDASIDYLFTRSGPPSLTLITCAGSWDRQRGTYAQRLLVRASLVPPTPTATPGDEGG